MSVSLRAALVAVSLAAGIVGCGAADEDAKPDTKRAKSQAVKKDGVDTSKVRADMVSAVSASKAGPPVTLKFALNQRPMVGEPIDVEIALIPISELTRLFVKFQPSTGLTLVKGAETQFDSPKTGEPIHHIVTVQASVDGIYYITAAVVADAEDSSLTRTFSIPVIAGNGVAPPVKPTAKADAAPTDKSP